VSALTLRADAAARAAGALDVVVASLPVSLAFGDADTDLVALRAAELVDGLPAARGVLVVAPEPGASLPSATASPVAVVVDRGAAGHPAVEDIAAAVGATGPDALLEVRATAAPGADVATVVLEALAVVRAADAAFSGGRVIRSGTHGATVRGTTAHGRPVLVDVVLTAARPAAVAVRAIGPAAAVEALIPSAAAARPALVTVSDADGARTLPTRWETAHRAAARRLRDAVLSGTASSGTAPDDLAELRDDLAALTALGL
jgi:hypothetical protein